MQNGFTARKTNFCGQSGYSVSQYIDGKEVINQFIPETSYKAFCELTGAKPIIIDKE